MSLLDPIRAALRQRGLGYLPDLQDDDDWVLGSAPFGSGGIAHEGGVRSLGEPKAQGGTQSCTGQAIVQGYRETALANGVDCPDLSGLSNYHWGRAVWGGQKADGGSFLRTGIQAAAKLGIPTEAKWPFNALKVNVAPSMPAVFEAAKRRLKLSYYRIATGDVDGVRRALHNKCAVVGGWQVDRAFTQDQGDWQIGEQNRGQIVGGHAALLDWYYSNGHFDLLNSWGRTWRDGGRVRVTEGFVAHGVDIWAIMVTL